MPYMSLFRAFSERCVAEIFACHDGHKPLHDLKVVFDADEHLLLRYLKRSCRVVT